MNTAKQSQRRKLIREILFATSYLMVFLVSLVGCKVQLGNTPRVENPVKNPAVESSTTAEKKVFLFLMDDLKRFDTFFVGRFDEHGKMVDIDESLFLAIRKKNPNVWQHSQCVVEGDGIRLKNSNRKGVLLNISRPIGTSGDEVIVPCGFQIDGLAIEAGHCRLRREKGEWVVIEKKFHPLA
jgi:hypothetical protein